MKIFLSVDIEGATGIASFSQCGRPSGQHYDFAFARRMLTGDVNAAIRGARAAGATEIVVKDAHGSCKNLLVDELEPGTQLISGFYPRNDYMMDGLDESFGAAMLVGYHPMAGALRGMMEHALSGGVHRFWVNGVLAGEIAVSAALAGSYGVPLVLVTSDQAGCDEAVAAVPGVRTYATKEGYGRYMGRLLHPSETWPAMEAAAKEAVSAAGGIAPYAISGPVTMRAEFRNSEEADYASMLPDSVRVDAYTIELTRPTFRLAHSAMLAVFQLAMRGRASGD
ncbi:MAG TPA: M55 family metallopeptidase [Fimbriimonadaceae bacterium]|nr:M55 family metallopeptidase [Fimbriimonadaceae bacterium]